MYRTTFKAVKQFSFMIGSYGMITLALNRYLAIIRPELYDRVSYMIRLSNNF